LINGFAHTIIYGDFVDAVSLKNLSAV